MSKDLIRELKKYQKDRGLSRQELAKELGVSLVTLRRWLSKRGKPSHLAEVRIEAVMERKRSRKFLQDVGKRINRLGHLVKLASNNGLEFSEKTKKKIGRIIINFGARIEGRK